MACDSAALYSSACTAGFTQAAANEAQFRALVLELLYLRSGSTDTLAVLLRSACLNGFDQAAQNEHQFRALELQLLCQLTGG